MAVWRDSWPEGEGAMAEHGGAIGGGTLCPTSCGGKKISKRSVVNRDDPASGGLICSPGESHREGIGFWTCRNMSLEGLNLINRHTFICLLSWRKTCCGDSTKLPSLFVIPVPSRSGQHFTNHLSKDPQKSYRDLINTVNRVLSNSCYLAMQTIPAVYDSGLAEQNPHPQIRQRNLYKQIPSMAQVTSKDKQNRTTK